MTTQVLMSPSVILPSIEAANHSQQPSDGVFQASASTTAIAPKSSKLPYQANHQVELLHLQAEIEALFQHLETLKRQRSLIEQSEHESISSPVLASR